MQVSYILPIDIRQFRRYDTRLGGKHREEAILWQKKDTYAAIPAGGPDAGNVLETILVFSLPVILSYLLQQIYTISDAAIVGQTLTAQEVAGVNDTSSLVFIFCSLPSASARASAW